MSPKVAEKFKGTDFVRQKRALRASFHIMLVAAGDEDQGPDLYMRQLAQTHNKNHFDIGAELYDYWLDALLATVREFDDKWDHEVESAWEKVMGIGIQYLLSHYNDPD
ncbi:MAG: globin [Acidobacteria bacterium]|nr:globin [Acidobacteriota bacterium]NIQ31144.1 globin [Acidobacteriota bacterium]NIQ86280.1 globin [Acidobacteriota bacterium]